MRNASADVGQNKSQTVSVQCQEKLPQVLFIFEITYFSILLPVFAFLYSTSLKTRDSCLSFCFTLTIAGCNLFKIII